MISKSSFIAIHSGDSCNLVQAASKATSLWLLPCTWLSCGGKLLSVTTDNSLGYCHLRLLFNHGVLLRLLSPKLNCGYDFHKFNKLKLNFLWGIYKVSCLKK